MLFAILTKTNKQISVNFTIYFSLYKSIEDFEK